MCPKLNTYTLLLVVVGLLYYSYVGRFLVRENSHDTIMLLTIYVLARIMSIKQESLSVVTYLKNKFVMMALLLMVMFFPVLLSAFGMPFKFFEFWFQNNNILYLLLSASFVLVLSERQFYHSLTNRLSGGIIAVYLITESEMVRITLDSWLYNYILRYIGYLYVIAVCIVCLLVDQVRKSLFDIVIKKFHSIAGRKTNRLIF